MQRLQFDLGEKISRKEYLKRKKKSSRLLKKRSKITYMLLACFIGLGIYIVIQLLQYNKYNSFKYTEGDGVNKQPVYSILFVTEGYTYDPVYSVSTTLSSGDQEKSILPSSDIRNICVAEECFYGLKGGSVCKIDRDNYTVEQIFADDVKKFTYANNFIFYITNAEERLKAYSLETGETFTFDITNVKQVLASKSRVIGVVGTFSEKEIYCFDYYGQGKWKISGDAKATNTILSDEKLYFINKSDDERIYTVNTDGSGLGRVAEISGVSNMIDDEKDGSSYMFVDKGKLYYVNTKDGHALWSYDLTDGTNEKVLTSSIAMLGNIDDTIIYKVNGEMGIYLYNVETKYMSLVTKRRVKEFVIDKYKEIKVVVE